MTDDLEPKRQESRLSVIRRIMPYVVGDASRAYSSSEAGAKEETGLTRFGHHIIMLRPSIVVVYDEMEADHDAEWSWLIHSYDKMGVDEEKYTITAKNAVAEGRVSLFGSVPLDRVLSDQFSVKPENWRQPKDEEGDTIEYRNQWHFKGVTRRGTSRMRYLAIIQVLPNATRMGFADIHRKEDNRFDVDEWTINAELRYSEPPMINVRKRDGTTAFVSSGPVTPCGKEYNDACPESSKLVEIADDKELLLEAVDVMPTSMRDAGRSLR
jgi:hypothetical protein